MRVQPIKDKKRVIIILWILIAVLVLTNVWTAFFYKRISGDSSAQKEYPFLDPVREFDRSHRIVDFQSLREDLNKTYTNYPNNAIAIYFEYLPTGENIAVNKDFAFYPASLVKIPMALAVAKKIERGEWKLANELVLMAGDQNPGYGELYKKPVGTHFTIEELLRELLINSDNTAHLIFLRNVGFKELFEIHERLGIEDIYAANGGVTVKNFSNFLRALYQATYVSGKYANMVLGLLSQSPREFVAAGAPPDVKVAHKIGVMQEKNVYADPAIIYIPNRPYILTVMIWSRAESPREEAPRIMKEISEKVYQYVSMYQ